ncbi:LpxI family protein [Pacificoceanicola onchidii]|uniref:LpxI family protein n=1 Tax=Pacificoceanicola onchidii TaxID=2562685 RepID=UPI001F0DF39D|nr:UDP-2,3-diacylglucosamine diphosphatase LpxI [Pacificoceanicola onchidii]
MTEGKLALIAGRGALPAAVVSALPETPVICALRGSEPDGVIPAHVFSLERLGGFLNRLRKAGVTRLCLCGAVDRPGLSLMKLDLATMRMLPRIRRALRQGDDGALRIAMGLIEDAGFEVVAAHEVAPSLLPEAGVLTRAEPQDAVFRAAEQGDAVSHAQATDDLGQACVVTGGAVIAREGQDGTDAMLARLSPAPGAVFYKAPKPGQDRRADLPVIGAETARRAVELGLSGLVIEAGGVMVLDRAEVLRILDEAGLFLWVRERPE